MFLASSPCNQAMHLPSRSIEIEIRLPVSDRSAETTIQRQGRHLQWRRSQDEYSRYVQSLVPEGQLFWHPRHAGPGPINFIDVHPHLETALPHSVTASGDWIFQWRESSRDGVYSVPISDYSRRKERRAFRRVSSRRGGALASESSSLVSGRLRNFLRGEIR